MRLFDVAQWPDTREKPRGVPVHFRYFDPSGTECCSTSGTTKRMNAKHSVSGPGIRRVTSDGVPGGINTGSPEMEYPVPLLVPDCSYGDHPLNIVVEVCMGGRNSGQCRHDESAKGISKIGKLTHR